jgi:very-short-patch-repair endonuclease
MKYNSNLNIFKSRRAELRGNSTKAEILLWARLRNKQLNRLKFRRQHSFGAYIVDFYCKELGLVIELDGDVHIGREEYDLQRSNYLNQLGLRVIRFNNNEVLNNVEGVSEIILQTPPNLPFKKGRN